MNHYDTKDDYKQQEKYQYKHELEQARQDWEAKKNNLVEEINKLGYNNISLDDFLLEFPSTDKTQDEMSHFIQIQTEVKALEEDRQQLWAEEIAVEELNQMHATIHQEQFYILTEKPDLIFGGIDFSLESPNSLKSQYENKLIKCYDGKMHSKASVWLKSPMRREFKGFVFDPEKKITGYYNLWQGFTKEPREGDCSLFWDHVKNNICSGNDQYYAYVRRWLSIIFQRPSLLHTGLVLKGSQGTGKNSFVEPLGVLLGQHFAPLCSMHELFSNFNAHLKHATLIHANEAFWGGDRREIGKLKAIVTDEYYLVEKKGKDRFKVKSNRHLIISSNEDWCLHLDADDRRFFVLNISDAHKEDNKYFKAIKDQLMSGGYEALLYDLLKEDLAGFDPRTFPKSLAAFDIKFRSADSTHKYLHDVLLNASFEIGKSEPGKVWQLRIPTQCAYEDYGNWCEINGERKVNNNIFGKNIIKLIPSIKKTRTSNQDGRIWEYDLPSLKQAREDFCTAYKVGNEIWEGGVAHE